MKFFRKSDHQKNSVLFVCVENAGRSQMAEGFFRKYSPEGYEPLSAGTLCKHYSVTGVRITLAINGV